MYILLYNYAKDQSDRYWWSYLISRYIPIHNNMEFVVRIQIFDIIQKSRTMLMRLENCITLNRFKPPVFFLLLENIIKNSNAT